MGLMLIAMVVILCICHAAFMVRIILKNVQSAYENGKIGYNALMSIMFILLLSFGILYGTDWNTCIIWSFSCRNRHT